ncbi:MAG: hypothetical protein RL705_1096, partial [Bacteroidota bacterium]
PTVKDDYIRVRTNKELKKKATEIVESMQLDMSTVINMTLDQIVRHGSYVKFSDKKMRTTF